MAKASPSVISIIRKTAKALKNSHTYQWGHMGSCNCGFLAQQITQYTSADIHQRAMQKYGNWNDQLNDYCPTSGLLMDDLITSMLEFGFDSDDLKHLEKLSDTKILHTLPLTERYLTHNIKADVIKYLNAWAGLLENQLTDKIQLTNLNKLESNKKTYYCSII